MKLKVTNVQLPDGRWLTIEGGDAEGTAKLLVNHYLGQGSAVADGEEPLAMPGLAFDNQSPHLRHSASPIHNLPPPQQHVGSEVEEPLVMPTINFSKEPAKQPQSVAANEGEETPLQMPAMTF